MTTLNKAERAALQALTTHGELGGMEIVLKSRGKLTRAYVYVILARLEMAGLVSLRYLEPDAPSPKRRVYRLTRQGQDAWRGDVDEV